MGYQIEQGAMYMMPTHFGPMAGPRQGPDLKPFSHVTSPRSTTYTVSFLTDTGQLEALCPPGFAVAGEPVVTIASVHMTEEVRGASLSTSIDGEDFSRQRRLR